MNKRVCLLLLMAMMLFSQCRKQGDDFRSPARNQSNQPLISNANINAWVVKNPAMQYITLDWSKARQANIDGKNIVRVPTLNIDKSPANKTTSKIGTMGSSQDGDISNYYQEHPPEIFFVQDPNSSKPDSLQAYMLNFVPASRGAEFGQNGIWTGKLYDWDLNSPGLHVQELAKNKVTSKYILRLQKQDVNDLSIGSNSVWTWLGEFFGGIGDAVWSAVNYIGFYLGITGSHIRAQIRDIC